MLIAPYEHSMCCVKEGGGGDTCDSGSKLDILRFNKNTQDLKQARLAYCEWQADRYIQEKVG